MTSQYTNGTIAFGHGSFLFNGLLILHDANFTIRIHGDSKLESLSCFPIDRRRQKQVSEMLNTVELRAFRSIDSSVEWLDKNASMLCSFYSSWLQQRTPNPKVQDLIDQVNVLKVLKKHGTSISYGNLKMASIVYR